MKPCPACGMPLEDSYLACFNCGTPVDSATMGALASSPPVAAQAAPPPEAAPAVTPPLAAGRRTIVAGGNVTQAAPSATGGGRNMVVAGRDAVQQGSVGSSGTGGRNIVTAGRDVVQASGDLYKADGDLIVNMTVVEGQNHDQHLAEYRHCFREMLDVLKRSRRAWLKPKERRQLDELAARLEMQEWEQRDCEGEVEEKLGFTLGSKPSELWHVAVGEQYLAKDKERQAAAEALADYLDKYDDQALKVWRNGMPGWAPLASEAELLAATREQRKTRYRQLLFAAVEGRRLDASREALVRAAAGISAAEANEIRRDVEKRSGKPVVFAKPAKPADAGETSAPVIPLDGEYEAVKDFSVRVEISRRTFHLSHSRPYLKQGTARIDDLVRDGDQFSFNLSHHAGDYARITGVEGRVSKTGMMVERLRGAILGDQDRVFVTEFKRQ